MLHRPRHLGRHVPNAIALVAAASATPAALAHTFEIHNVELRIRADGTYAASVQVDLDALAVGASSGAPSAEVVASIEAMTDEQREDAEARAMRTVLVRTRVEFDGEKEIPDVTFPSRGPKRVGDPPEPTYFGISAELSGPIPPGARTVRFRASRAFNAIRLTILDERTGFSTEHLLGPAEASPPFPLDGAPPPAQSPAFFQYVVLGFEHIIPKGLDHILFVLGLFLLSLNLKPLLLQISAFTLAHTITLALAMTGVVSLPSSVVEPLIAASIAYVAIENIATSKLKWWRTLVVFGFGLLHGLGFAGVLTDLGLPPGQFVSSLVGFNIGVELGQLTVVALALAVTFPLRRLGNYRRAFVVPASAAIAAVGLYWAVERTLGG